MAVHAVYISAKSRDGSATDLALRTLFSDVYRIGGELWLVDALVDAEDVARAARMRLSREDKVFVAALTRDVWSGLSPNARTWLQAPSRSWYQRDAGLGLGAPDAGAVAAVPLMAA
jgi:hypothetical protein